MPAVAPFGYQYAATSFPFGTLVKPGGNVVAYVRSTGAQEGDDPFAASGLLVSTIDAGCNRCRSGQRDIVVVLPGHVETFTAAGAIWPSLKAGTQIIGAANAGGSSAPTVNLNQVAASVALNVADVTVHGLNIVSASVLTAGIVITAAGVTLSGCFVNSTGALAANSLIQVTGAANCSIVGNVIVCNNTTGAMINVTGAASTNFLIQGNKMRQSQAAAGGDFVEIANTLLISGMCCDNYGKTATTLATPGTGFFLNNGNVLVTVANVENYVAGGSVGTAAIVATGATGN